MILKKKLGDIVDISSNDIEKIINKTEERIIDVPSVASESSISIPSVASESSISEFIKGFDREAYFEIKIKKILSLWGAWGMIKKYKQKEKIL